MRPSTLFYRRLASPLHAARAGVAVTWTLALIAATMLLYSPPALAVLCGAVLAAAAAAGVGRELARALRTAAFLALPIVFVNVLVSREGLTVFARLGDLGPFGQGDLTVEALAFGGVIALKVTLLILVCTLASLAVDPDALLAQLRRLSFRSALTASLAVRMVPLLAADAQRFAEAQRTRPDGGARGPRARAAVLSAVVVGALDRALDVAATLELRGVAGAPTTRIPRRKARACGRGAHGVRAHRAAVARLPWSRHDLAFAASAVAVLALAFAGRASGAAAFDAYPELHMRLDGGTLALCTALALATLLPFADRRGTDAPR